MNSPQNIPAPGQKQDDRANKTDLLRVEHISKNYTLPDKRELHILSCLD